eukprot:m51a1_g11547 hypothetical protein (168) ;mRNA; r:12154-13425
MVLGHDDMLAGHGGVDRTYHAIKQVVTWPGMYDDICHFVHTCPTCQKVRPATSHADSMETVPGNAPYEFIVVDYLGPLQEYLAKKRGRSHFDIGDYVLLDKDHDHKLDINVRGPFQVIEKLNHHCYTVENLLRDFGDDDPRSWISYDNNKNVDQVVTYMQAHPHLRT